METGNKGVYDYYMIQEIEEQPRSIRQALLQDEKVINKMAKAILRAVSSFVACGYIPARCSYWQVRVSKIGRIF